MLYFNIYQKYMSIEIDIITERSLTYYKWVLTKSMNYKIRRV